MRQFPIRYKKVTRLQNFFQLNKGSTPELSRFIEALKPGNFKKSFLIFNKQKYQTILTETVAYFCIKEERVVLVCMDGSEYFPPHTLEEIQNMDN